VEKDVEHNSAYYTSNKAGSLRARIAIQMLPRDNDVDEFQHRRGTLAWHSSHGVELHDGRNRVITMTVRFELYCIKLLTYMDADVEFA
jgi:hypothetical protein